MKNKFNMFFEGFFVGIIVTLLVIMTFLYNIDVPSLNKEEPVTEFVENSYIITEKGDTLWIKCYEEVHCNYTKTKPN